MMNLRMLALFGVVAVLGMAGCGKKKEHRVERSEKPAKNVKKNHRVKGAKKNKRAEKRNARREAREGRYEERNMFAK